ncbi:hypothetical protein [Mongoliitalea daihaiensis]|uniref:hypothetical protein n=1 Tax=Mongoliitalea daihaiensis TaxID=2782006 RepID=UPI001F17FE9B|nr:hypothetical protein [Mongoliitalea daihaiensis]UJP65816.1 hypothetical protein IPZ59_04110 [Mongoliitalea daihaiensis]
MKTKKPKLLAALILRQEAVKGINERGVRIRLERKFQLRKPGPLHNITLDTADSFV